LTGFAAVAAVTNGILALLFSGADGVGAILVIVGFLGGIMGISLAVVALDRLPGRRWQARVGLGLSALALGVSFAFVAVLVILVLAIISGARQGG
jgi:hypothetical protein